MDAAKFCSIIENSLCPIHTGLRCQRLTEGRVSEVGADAVIIVASANEISPPSATV